MGGEEKGEGNRTRRGGGWDVKDGREAYETTEFCVNTRRISGHATG